MAFRLSDIYIGTFPITQNFGDRAAIYKARYGLLGHNGIDIGTPQHTMVVSAASGWVSEVGFDAGGYGNYLKVVHSEYLTLYAHLNDLQVKKGDRVVQGQLLGHSGNTGFSDGPHLHFGVAPCDANGIKTEVTNGYSGYINPRGDRVAWETRDIKEPVSPSVNDKPPVEVPFDVYPQLVAKATNYDNIALYAVSQGINDFLGAKGMPMIDTKSNPKDPDAASKIVAWISNLLEENEQYQDRVNEPQVLTESQQQSLVSKVSTTVATALKGFFIK